MKILHKGTLIDTPPTLIKVKNKSYYCQPVTLQGSPCQGYFATACGQVISYRGQHNGRNSKVSKKDPRILSPCIDNAGYESVRLHTDNGVCAVSVHRVVAFSWYEKPPRDRHGNKRSEVHHINGNKTDNRLVNLEFNSRQENQSNNQHVKAIQLELATLREVSDEEH
jgi:hypothetical protein